MSVSFDIIIPDQDFVIYLAKKSYRNAKEYIGFFEIHYTNVVLEKVSPQLIKYLA